MTDESKYHTTYCRRCGNLVEVRNKRIHGKTTVLCRTQGETTPTIRIYHGPHRQAYTHNPENICKYYAPKQTTSYHQLALESKRLTELNHDT